MIVISFLLVVIAAVTLLVGLFQDTLTWIWASIGACVLAMIFLGIGVLQRRSDRTEPEEDDGSAYGPGAISSLIPGSEDDERAAVTPDAEEISVVPKRTVSDAQGEISRAEVEDAADAAVAEAEVRAGTDQEPAAVAEEAEKETAARKKTAKKATKKTAAEKKTARKKTAKKATKKAERTTGKAARERLGEVKGLGPAKQKALLSEFGSLEAIRDADVASLQQVKGIGEATAKEIRKQLS